MKTTIVYLLHFREPVAAHAQHYLGSTANLEERLKRHREGNGSPLVAAAGEFELVRTWEGDKTVERKLKNQKNNRRLCPLCRPAYNREAFEQKKARRERR